MEWSEPLPTDVLPVPGPSWLDGFMGLFGVALAVPLVCLVVFVLLGRWGGATGVRRRFWCRLARRNVEVEFLSRGLAPRLVSVKWCSAFEPRTAVRCRQQCLDGHARAVPERTAQAS
jgi:hypothetical protein